jgi:hypothetical protein
VTGIGGLIHQSFFQQGDPDEHTIPRRVEPITFNLLMRIDYHVLCGSKNNGYLGNSGYKEIALVKWRAKIKLFR